MQGEAFDAAFLVGEALDALGVDYHLGGSLASSIHGIPRATLDADLVADLRPGQGLQLRALLGEAFYADAWAMEDAIVRRRSFNVIHLASLFKVDVFVRGESAFQIESFSRSRPEAIGRGGHEVKVATPEDTVLHKLLWFAEGGGVSTRQWDDLVGVLRVQGSRLDSAYLLRWAATLGLGDLLSRALEAAAAPP